MRRFWRLVRPHATPLGGAFILSLFYVFFDAVTLWLSASFITTLFTPEAVTSVAHQQVTEPGLNLKLKLLTAKYIFSDGPVEALRLVVIIIVISYLLKSIAYYFSSILHGLVQQRVVEDLRNDLVAHFLGQPLSFFHARRSGDLISLTMNDVNRVTSMLGNTFQQLMTSPLHIGTLLALLFVINWRLTLFSLIVVPLAGLVITRIGHSLRHKVVQAQAQLGAVTSRLAEILNGIKLIKAFTTEELEKKRFQREAHRFLQLMMRQIRMQSAALPLTEMMGVVTAAGLLWFGGLQVLKYKTATGEDFVRFIVLLFTIYQPVRLLAQAHVQFQAGMAAAGRVLEQLEQPSAIRDQEGALELPPFSEEIRFENVSFQYPAGKIPAVKEINLTIRKGQVVALVGPSGAGKTTLVDLIPRFYDVTAGAIYIDGYDIRQVTRRSLRRQLGIVSQQTVLFNDTIRHNIAYGMEATLEEVEEAARKANAHDFISALPQGYDTVVGEHGVTLSGGERQRLAIARALLKDPAILILDEATSALDTESERLVQAAIEQLMQNRTTLVIAHRLSTVLHADLIVVLSGGRIVEQGTHEELLAKGGLYRKLYELQFAVEQNGS